MAQYSELRDELGAFFLALNPSYVWVPFQQLQIIPHLEAVERGEIERLAIFMPPGHSKSDLSTRTFIPWFLGRNPRKNAMVCSYSADLASDDFVANIKERMNSDLYKKVFPESVLTRDSHSKTHFTTRSGGHFYSVGFQGGITGKRLDLMVLDDLIKNKGDAESDPVQQDLFDTYRSTVKDRMRPGGRIVMCMHRWLITDVPGRILEMDGRVEDGGAWTVLNLPAEDPPESGHFLWEEYYGRKYYLDFKKDDDTWAAKFQQDPQSQSGYKFREEWLQFYDVAPPPGRFKAYIFCDPAASKSKSSDFTVICVFCPAQDKRLLLVDWVWDRLDPGERTDHILRLCRKWNPEGLYYETYGLNSDIFYMKEKMAEGNFPPSAHPVALGKTGPGHNNSKEVRIDGLIPYYRRGLIVLPRRYERARYDGTKLDYTERFIEKEYKPYRGKKSIPHEDNLDCQSRIADPMVRIDYDLPQELKSYQRQVPQGSSWVAVY